MVEKHEQHDTFGHSNHQRRLFGPQVQRQHRTLWAHMKEKSMDYTFLANLHEEFAPPEDGILSRILHKDEKVNVTLFGVSAGQELSAHSAPTPAILYFLDGEAEVQFGGG